MSAFVAQPPHENPSKLIANCKTDEFIKVQDRGMEEFVNKRERLIKAHKERMFELRCRHWDEEMALEKEFNKQDSTGPNL
ncbi:hypothetical protein PHJA_002442300 [Phtheirospermum japonicum]|uniref:Uncharacterized protein n=1 Tax=Phtheirospermum japonicum TaxID=374723 RepID=A0A830D3E6_9LAMI|nr:hypothetical protein PHJA_002442300 [Phtheirospermum japonicum]